MRVLASSVLAAAAFAACGGKVVIDPGTGGAGGTGGSGGATSSVSASSSSSSASSSSSSSSTGGMGCPTSFPGIEASCDQEGLVCPVPLSCCGGQAVCKGGFWTFLGPLCDQPCALDCGPDGFACQPGVLCVTYIGMVTTYQCRVNPCFEKVGCGCVESYCEEQGMMCNNIQDGDKVLCD